MSKDLPQQPQQSEEVDLGQLFNLIGKMFEKLFSFIGQIISKLYDVLLLLLIHFFKRIKWYILVVVLGIIVGYFLDKKASKVYGASMQLETNYNSARQVYENISFLNQLAAVDQDSVELGKRLNISPSEAKSIKGFSIKPNIDENDKMKLFSDFRAQLDSLTRSTFTYNDYIDGLSSHSFSTHQIEVTSDDKFIYSKLNDGLPKELADNSYLNEIKDVTLENFVRREKVLQAQKRTLDSLSDFYLDIRKSEAAKNTATSGSGTNLFLGEMRQESLVVDETKIIERRLELDNERLKLYLESVENKYIVNPISEFPAAGYDIRQWTEKAKFRLPLLFALITLIFFIGLGLVKYLNKEEQRLLGERK
ncbi:hypothetical protein [Algibacter sp. 2305UL17-15]|uniref:hypothetical protein n=1 Tax=Algibacter sp. 2305UL17-15 TaxID=3231268 RepID=UPI003458A3EF